MSLLRKILEKRGIADVTKLTKEEKEDFDNYEKILSKPDLTLKDLQSFMESQIAIIETRWKDYGLEHSKKSELIAYHTIYRTLLDVIKSPQVEREVLEKYLTNLHKL